MNRASRAHCDEPFLVEGWKILLFLFRSYLGENEKILETKELELLEMRVNEVIRFFRGHDVNRSVDNGTEADICRIEGILNL